jgi:hypothetical protein
VMHPARLSFLATRHAQRRAITSRDIRSNGTTLFLECGHTCDIAPHFDVSSATDGHCIPCGRAFVLNGPLYAEELKGG